MYTTELDKQRATTTAAEDPKRLAAFEARVAADDFIQRRCDEGGQPTVLRLK